MKTLRGHSVATWVAVVGVVLGLAAVPVILEADPASASTLNGTATITNQTLSPLSSGASTTEFSVALAPTGATPAECSGDTASHGYHVYSYLVQAGTSISGITFTNHPSVGYGLVNNVGVYYGSQNTAQVTGQIIGVPTNFEFAPLLSDGATLSSLLYGGTSGVWEAGLACANSSGALTDYWNTQVTFTSSGSDPNGFVWSAYQVTPTTASTTTTASAGFTQQLAASNASGPVSYTVTSPSSALSVTSGGHVSTTGALAAGAYTVSGTDTDTGGDSGPWSFTLTVSTVTLAQGAPKTASVSTTASGTFTDQLSVPVAVGAVTYTVTSPATGVNVSSTGAVSTTGTLAANAYAVSGTDHDTDGDTGTWSFTLTVAAGSLTQAPPTSATVPVASSGTFTDQLAVSGANGAVTYTVTTPATGIDVSPSGAISTTGTLTPGGSYTVSGTDHDVDGDTGTWTFTLTVQFAPDSFTSADSTTATVGQTLSFAVTTTPSGAKIKSSGKLPKGVKFNKGAGLLAGTPTSTKHKSAAGTYPLTFTATFGKGKTKVVTTQSFTLTVES
jgi:hypothetical protein